MTEPAGPVEDETTAAKPDASLTTVEAVVRAQLAKALGGRRGMVEAAVPTILFTVMWLTTRELRVALVVSVASALVLLVARLVQRSTVQFVVNAMVGIGIGWFFVTLSARNGGSEDDAKAFLTKLLNNTIALPASGREATTAFTDGSGDVLLSYENEAILAKQSGADIDYVLPPDTLLIQNPAAVTKDAGTAAKAFLKFMTSPEAQEDYAESGFRPVVDGVDVGEVEGANDPSDPFPTPDTLYTLDDNFGGWGEAADKFFGDGQEGNPLGIVTELQQNTGKEGEE